MSALYEIQEDILSCIDRKTGEIIDVERLHGLQMERRQKIRNIACWIKNLLADAHAYEEEEKTFVARKTAAKNKADSLKQYLSDCLHGEKIQDKEFSIGWRKSQKIHIDEGAPAWDDAHGVQQHTDSVMDERPLCYSWYRGNLLGGIHNEENCGKNDCGHA